MRGCNLSTSGCPCHNIIFVNLVPRTFSKIVRRALQLCFTKADKFIGACRYSINTVQTYFNNQINALFLYSLTICMLHYNPQHVLSINMPIFRSANCIISASDIVTLCKRLYSMPDESRNKSILCCTVKKHIRIQTLKPWTLLCWKWIKKQMMEPIL